MEISRELYDKADEHKYLFKVPIGINEEVVRKISEYKKEPEWMLQKRLKALEIFNELQYPKWGPDLSKLDLNKITYFYIPDAKANANSWDDVPEEIKNTFERLGIPEAERKALAGVGAQYDSEVVYHNLKESLVKQGVIFENFDVAVQEYPELVQKYFMNKCVSPRLHKFAALHGAVFSGGTFIYIPKNIKVEMPLQAYFRMNMAGMGQFEHTLIVVDEGAQVHYVEGCSAPSYSSNSLHAGCVEVFVHKNARMRYSSVENWSINTYNLNTKRANIEENGVMEWVSGNLGCLTGDSKVSTNPKGPTNIENIQVGDKVFAWNSATNKIEKTKVNALIPTGKKDIYKIKAGGRELKATSNHPFLTIEKRKNAPHHKKAFFHSEWKPLSELKKGSFIAIAKSLPDIGKPYKIPEFDYNKLVESKNQYLNKFQMNIAHLYQKITLPKYSTNDFMWFLGLLIGDGHVYYNKKNAKINIAVHEKSDHRKITKKLIKNIFNIDNIYEQDRFIVINSVPLAETLKSLEMIGTALTKKIPFWIHTLPIEQKMHFLAGYFDADGHVGKNGVYLTSINYDLLDDVKDLALSCGISYSQIFNHSDKTKTIIMGVECNANKSHRILLNGKKIKNLPSKNKTKLSKIKKIKTSRAYSGGEGNNFKSKTNEFVGYARVTDIDFVGKKQTFDIQVDKYHNFVANGMIVHNSGTTMLYPASLLLGEGAKADHITIAYAGKNQNQDTGAKVYHLAPRTTSTINSKSLSKGGGIAAYRGLVKIRKGAFDSKCSVTCDALMFDNESQSNTYPYIEVEEKEVDMVHEASVGKISEEQLFYLQSRGLSEEQALQMIVSGFMEPLLKELPLEYAVEMNRLIELEMEGSLG